MTPTEFKKKNEYNDKLELAQAILFTLDKLKDLLYTIRFPHASPRVAFWLWFSLMAPFTIIWIIDRNFIEAFKLFSGFDAYFDKIMKKDVFVKFLMLTMIVTLENSI